MRLRAKAGKATGESTNYIGTIADEKPAQVEQLPNPVWLEISEEDGAFFLLYINAGGECFADTWHQTLENAQREALLGFGVTPEEWTRVCPSPGVPVQRVLTTKKKEHDFPQNSGENDVE